MLKRGFQFAPAIDLSSFSAVASLDKSGVPAHPGEPQPQSSLSISMGVKGIKNTQGSSELN